MTQYKRLCGRAAALVLGLSICLFSACQEDVQQESSSQAGGGPPSSSVQASAEDPAPPDGPKIAVYQDPKPEEKLPTPGNRIGEEEYTSKMGNFFTRQNWLNDRYSSSQQGELSAENFFASSPLVAELKIEGILGEDDCVAIDFTAEKIPDDIYTYFKAKVEKVYKGDSALKGQKIILAQDGCSRAIIRGFPLYSAGNRVLAFLEPNPKSGARFENSARIFAGEQGSFSRVSYDGKEYAVKDFSSFRDLTPLQAGRELRGQVVAQKYKSGFVQDIPGPLSTDINRDPPPECDQQVLELSALEEMFAGLQ